MASREFPDRLPELCLGRRAHARDHAPFVRQFLKSEPPRAFIQAHPPTERSLSMYQTTTIATPGTARAIGLLTDFGGAIRALKAGQRVARVGWNGKGMWLSLSCDGSREVPAANFWSPHNKAHAEASGGKATVLPSITMKTATGEILMGWLASQTDMLAEDWVVLDELDELDASYALDPMLGGTLAVAKIAKLDQISETVGAIEELVRNQDGGEHVR